MSHPIQCPNCGFPVAYRAEMGKGTTRGASMKVNTNRQAILEVLNTSSHGLTVREVQSALVARNIKRVSRGNVGWNYHSVQADLSILVGMGRVAMRSPSGNEYFDPEFGYAAKSVPRYVLNKVGSGLA